jgi:hypothetical protein
MAFPFVEVVIASPSVVEVVKSLFVVAGVVNSGKYIH